MVQGLGLRGYWVRVEILALRGLGFGFGVQGSGFRVQGSGFRVQGSGFRFGRQVSATSRGRVKAELLLPLHYTQA